MYRKCEGGLEGSPFAFEETALEPRSARLCVVGPPSITFGQPDHVIPRCARDDKRRFGMRPHHPRAIRFAAVLLLLGANGLRAQQSAADSIRSLDQGWGRAYALHDTAFAQQLFARDIVITNSAGAPKTRDQELAD